MITAEMLTTLTTFSAEALTRAINLAGHKGDVFTSAKFLGMTTGGQFCYWVVYPVDSGGTDSTKVFLTYDAGQVTAEY